MASVDVQYRYLRDAAGQVMEDWSTVASRPSQDHRRLYRHANGHVLAVEDGTDDVFDTVCFWVGDGNLCLAPGAGTMTLPTPTTEAALKWPAGLD